MHIRGFSAGSYSGLLVVGMVADSMGWNLRMPIGALAWPPCMLPVALALATSPDPEEPKDQGTTNSRSELPLITSASIGFA